MSQNKINFNVIQPKNLIGSPLSDHMYMSANQIGYENLNELENILSLPEILDNHFNYIYYPVIDVAAYMEQIVTNGKMKLTSFQIFYQE